MLDNLRYAADRLENVRWRWHTAYEEGKRVSLFFNTDTDEIDDIDMWLRESTEDVKILTEFWIKLKDKVLKEPFNQLTIDESEPCKTVKCGVQKTKIEFYKVEKDKKKKEEKKKESKNYKLDDYEDDEDELELED